MNCGLTSSTSPVANSNRDSIFFSCLKNVGIDKVGTIEMLIVERGDISGFMNSMESSITAVMSKLRNSH